MVMTHQDTRILIFEQHFTLGNISPTPSPTDASSLSFIAHTARSCRVDWSWPYPTPAVVVARTRVRLGERNYNLFTCNCEHFASYCPVGVATSSQVQHHKPLQ
jgi:hypothetical protein